MTFRERLTQLWTSIFGPRNTDHEPMAGHPIPRSDQLDIDPESEDPPKE